MLVTAWLQVRKRPLNKKELTKNEEDIITIEPHSSSLAVHETKLKVSVSVVVHAVLAIRQQLISKTKMKNRYFAHVYHMSQTSRTLICELIQRVGAL